MPESRELTFGARILGNYAHLLFNQSVQAILYYLQNRRAPDLPSEQFAEELKQEAATFVTLERNQRLRGCIGSLQAHRPLILDIVSNTLAAGFSDPRFSPLNVEELEGLTISYSILSDSTPRSFNSEQELLDLLRPHVDGLIIEDKLDGEPKRAVYLPQVWEQIPDKKQFLQQLKIKAGMPAQHWSDSFQACTYSADKTTPMLFPKIK